MKWRAHFGADRAKEYSESILSEGPTERCRQFASMRPEQLHEPGKNRIRRSGRQHGRRMKSKPLPPSQNHHRAPPVASDAGPHDRAPRGHGLLATSLLEPAVVDQFREAARGDLRRLLKQLRSALGAERRRDVATIAHHVVDNAILLGEISLMHAGLACEAAARASAPAALARAAGLVLRLAGLKPRPRRPSPPPPDATPAIPPGPARPRARACRPPRASRRIDPENTGR